MGPWRYGNVMTRWYEGRVATDKRIWGNEELIIWWFCICIACKHLLVIGIDNVIIVGIIISSLLLHSISFRRSTCQNKGPPHLLLDIAQFIPQLVFFSLLSHPLSSTFGFLRLRHISDKFRNQLIVYNQYCAKKWFPYQKVIVH